MINWADRYPNQTSTLAGYPYGKANNVGVANDGTGFPLEKDWVNDWIGFVSAVFAATGTTPSGNPETSGTSQLHTALVNLMRLNSPRYVSYSSTEWAALPSASQLSAEIVYVHGTISSAKSIRAPYTLTHQLKRLSVHFAHLQAGADFTLNDGAGDPILLLTPQQDMFNVTLRLVWQQTDPETNDGEWRLERLPREQNTLVVTEWPVDGNDPIEVDAAQYGALRCNFELLENETPENGPVGAFSDGQILIDVGPATREGDEFSIYFDVMYPARGGDWLLAVNSDSSHVMATNDLYSDWHLTGGKGFTILLRVVDGAWRVLNTNYATPSA